MHLNYDFPAVVATIKAKQRFLINMLCLWHELTLQSLIFRMKNEVQTLMLGAAYCWHALLVASASDCGEHDTG